MQYSIGTKIKSGRFGNVYRVKKDGQLYAAKLLPKHRVDIPDKQNYAMIQREINHHKKVNGHANIVKMIEVVEDWGNYFIVEEYCQRGDLEGYMNRNDIDMMLAKQILRDCLRGLIACHKGGFIYGDLKPANILIGANMVFKLCDFGSTDGAADLYSGSIHVRGTPAFLAPESYVHHSDHGFITDMWSLGILAYVLLYQRYPFDLPAKCSAAEFKHTLMNCEIVFDDSVVGKEACDFMKLCLQKDSRKRLTPDDALKHPFLSEINNIR